MSIEILSFHSVAPRDANLTKDLRGDLLIDSLRRYTETPDLRARATRFKSLYAILRARSMGLSRKRDLRSRPREARRLRLSRAQPGTLDPWQP